MHWSKKEIRELRKQIREGVLLNDLKIGERPQSSIKYKVYSLGIKLIRWKKKEISFLRKLIKEGKKPWEIEIPGRSKTAIRNKSIRLGYWKTKKRYIRPWTIVEIERLRRLVEVCRYTAKMAVSNGHFLNRSKDSVGQQIRRMRLKK